MKSLLRFLGAFVFWSVVFFTFCRADERAWELAFGSGFNLNCVAVSDENENLILVGGKNRLLRTLDGGKSWSEVLLLSGINETVNFILSHPEKKNIFYVATNKGLYLTFDSGLSWEKIYNGRKGSPESNCLSLALNYEKIFLGTQGGVFVSSDNGKTWQKLSGRLGKEEISSIGCSFEKKGIVFVVSESGVYKSVDNLVNYSRIILDHGNSEKEEERNSDDKEKIKPKRKIRLVYVNPFNTKQIFLAGESGIFQSNDSGVTWENISDPTLAVKGVLVDEFSRIFAFDDKGVFEYQSGLWHDISFGLFAQVRRLAYGQRKIYAATDKGLFILRLEEVKNYSFTENPLQDYLKEVPDISKVQQAALEYAEVQPEKIINWRRQAAKKALLPKLQISMDFDRNRSSSSSIWGTYGSNGTPGRYFVGPDDETRYLNKNWAISLSWDLGEIIWNNDQTSIDVRSRLMVELRDDILNEVTKLYFERIKTKMELENLGLTEKKKRMEKTLRLNELTAYLDALTGGYFSKELAKRIKTK